MEDIVSQTKANYQRNKDKLAMLLSKTPDDKLNWAPSATARSAVQLVAHCADAVRNIHSMLEGKPFEFNGTVELDSRLRESDRRYTSREEVSALLDQNSTAFLDFLDRLKPEQLDVIVTNFAGQFPMSVGIAFPGNHMEGHIAQLEYLQTIWGDVDWYSPLPS